MWKISPVALSIANSSPSGSKFAAAGEYRHLYYTRDLLRELVQRHEVPPPAPLPDAKMSLILRKRDGQVLDRDDYNDLVRVADGEVEAMIGLLNEFPAQSIAGVEWQFDGPNDTMRFWLDGVAVDSMTVQGTGEGCVTPPSDQTWKAPAFDTLDLGWESYQGDSARTLYIDDVVLSTSRVGCPP